MPKKKKRKLKKSFIAFLYFFFFLILALTLFILNSKKIINLNGFWKTLTETTQNVSIGLQNNYKKLKEIVSKDTKTKNLNSENSLEESSGDAKTEEEFETIFRNRLPSKNLNLASSSPIAANGDMKFFLKDTENEAGYIIVNTKQKADYVWVTFVSAIDKNPLKIDLEKNLKKLEYVDLRYSNKIFYKFKTENEMLEEANNKNEENAPEIILEGEAGRETEINSNSLNSSTSITHSSTSSTLNSTINQ